MKSLEERFAKGRERNAKFVWWIHSWPCCVPDCTTPYPVHAHHVKHRGAGGSDLTCIPLCPNHHVMGGKAIHRMGKFSFERFHNLSLEGLVEQFNALYNDGKEGPYMDCLPPQSEAKLGAS